MESDCGWIFEAGLAEGCSVGLWYDMFRLRTFLPNLTVFASSARSKTLQRLAADWLHLCSWVLRLLVVS
jgi:hypothetical protein